MYKVKQEHYETYIQKNRHLSSFIFLVCFFCPCPEKQKKDINEAAEAKCTFVLRCKTIVNRAELHPAHPTHLQDMRTASKRHQKFPDFVQPRLCLLLCQAREFPGEGDIVVVARQHQLVLLGFHDRDAAVIGQDLQFRDLQ